MAQGLRVSGNQKHGRTISPPHASLFYKLGVLGIIDIESENVSASSEELKRGKVEGKSGGRIDVL